VLAKQNGIDRVFVHAFMDGRDTLPTNGAVSRKAATENARVQLRAYRERERRYYAMDRDRRWERIAKAFDVMVAGKDTAKRRARRGTRPVQG